MQQCPIKGVKKVKGGHPRGSLQWDPTQVQITSKPDVLKQNALKPDALKQAVVNPKLRGHHLCQVGRHQRITQRWQGHFDSQQDQVDEVVRNPLQNHDRMDSGRRYCLLITVHEATRGRHQALPKMKWNPTGIVNMLRDDLDVTKAVILDHITTILYIGR